MNNQNIYIIILIALFCISIYPKEDLLKYPDYFPEPSYNFNHNPLSIEKIKLGRILFYDPILSKDNKISCASCHSPFNAFAHTDHSLSHGIHDSIGSRNALALFNLAWSNYFMWDGAINHLDMQALVPINSPLELGEDFVNVIQKLNNSIKYKTYFYKAFQDSTITGERFLKALSQFELSLISSDSKYDKVRKGIDSFTQQEKRGFQLFLRNCNSCHTEPLFTNNKLANNGLNVDPVLNDYGKGKLTKQARDSFLFKIPSLRNLAYTYPYMHDGRFKRLKDVLQHYTSQIINSATLSPELINPIQLSSDEKIDLISFLNTLNDSTFVFNPNHQFSQ